MTPETLRADRLLRDLLEALHQGLAQGEEPGRLRLGLGGEPGQLLVQRSQDAPHTAPLGLVEGALIKGGEGDGGKGRGGRVGGQRQMHLRGPLAEHLRQRTDLPQDGLHRGGGGVAPVRQDGLGAQRRGRGRPASPHPCEVGVQRRLEHVPQFALIGHIALHNGHGHALTAMRGVGQRASDGRGMGEPMVGEKAPQLEIGIEPFVDAAEEFEHHVGAIAHRGVIVRRLEDRRG